ncbi:MAG: aldehyde dehydrogenase family protein [Actinobacteria bacterium]|nr:aldehyde dehydrogenase family protein [Actinomycetota bacterium]
MSNNTITDHVSTVDGVEVHTDHWINGRWVASADRFEDRSPIDGSHLADVAAGGGSEVDAAVAAARAAFPAWAALGPAGRAPILRRFAELINEHVDDIATVESVDNGSLLTGLKHAVVPRAALNVSFFAEHALTLGETIESPQVSNRVRFDPSGVAALITPWNAPFMLTTWKVGPALAAGNTIVVKPPEWAPLTAALLAQLSAQAGLPDGVLNLVQGIGSAAGAALVAHEDVDRISFTGSTPTARSIGRAAAETLTPVSFELGGKSPFVVLADADLDAAAQTIVAQYMNAGQVCLSGTRIIVDASIADELLDKVRTHTAALIVGDPRQPATRIGPLIHPTHAARVDGFVERARAAGARVLWGGGRHDAGELYYQPTMFDHVAHDSELFRSEVFGPVLSWHTVADADEAIAVANDQDYGLAATLFGRDATRTTYVADRLVAGTVWVNCYYVRELAAPFGGSRNSGIGREGGTWSFDFFCDVKNVATRHDSLTTSPHAGN